MIQEQFDFIDRDNIFNQEFNISGDSNISIDKNQIPIFSIKDSINKEVNFSNIIYNWSLSEPFYSYENNVWNQSSNLTNDDNLHILSVYSIDDKNITKSEPNNLISLYNSSNLESIQRDGELINQGSNFLSNFNNSFYLDPTVPLDRDNLLNQGSNLLHDEIWNGFPIDGVDFLDQGSNFFNKLDNSSNPEPIPTMME